MNHGYESPNIPPRNNMRNQHSENGGAGYGSGYGSAYEPPNPNSSNHNFSRPRGTVEGIKAAAHGIHVCAPFQCALSDLNSLRTTMLLLFPVL